MVVIIPPFPQEGNCSHKDYREKGNTKEVRAVARLTSRAYAALLLKLEKPLNIEGFDILAQIIHFNTLLFVFDVWVSNINAKTTIWENIFFLSHVAS